MAKLPSTSRIATLGLNLGLLVGGLALMVLLYGLITRFGSPRVDPTRADNPAQLVGDIIQVEVRNACGVAGLAAEMTQYMRRQGFDVVEVGNHSTLDVAQTVVIDRVGDLDAARKVAVALGLPEDRVRQEVDLEAYLDASILIGADYRLVHPFKDP